MSEALLDEIEAINSIYGDDTLVRSPQDPDPTVYILTLPGETASLRLQFPQTYPDTPPAVLGTHSSGSSGKRGAAARDLALFRDAVSEVYEPGQVCLFDAIEKVQELLAAVRETEAADVDEDGPGEEVEGRATAALAPPRATPPAGPDGPDDAISVSPPWILSDPVTELKSTFIARCAPVTSPAQAASFVQHLLASDKRVRAATHNITAWRIRGPNGTSFQDCDDDGETAAGGRLLHLMQLMDLWDTMVLVTRWYGGQKLGPRRFALINQVARDAFVKAGLVNEAGSGSGKKKGGR